MGATLAALLLLVLLLAGGTAAQAVVVRQLATQTQGLPTAEVMPVGHLLTVASDAGKRGEETSSFFRVVRECH